MILSLEYMQTGTAAHGAFGRLQLGAGNTERRCAFRAAGYHGCACGGHVLSVLLGNTVIGSYGKTSKSQGWYASDFFSNSLDFYESLQCNFMWRAGKFSDSCAGDFSINIAN